MADIFKTVAVDIPNKSGFDMSHENFFSSKCGTLTPALIDTLLPGDKVDLSAIANVQLPPFASDFYGRIEMKFEAFFVPFRLLYGGWKEFITIPLDFRGTTIPESTANTSRQVSSVTLPMARITASSTTDPSQSQFIMSDWFGAGSLADYLGYKVDGDNYSSAGTYTFDISLLPFVAYHKIWDDWYRDSRLVSSCFTKFNLLGSGSNVYNSVANLPYETIYKSSNINDSIVTNMQFAYGNQVSNGNYTNPRPHVFSLRQRSFAKDYFTNSTPLPQAGNQQSVGFTVNTSTGDGSFSIASLRAANSIQTWLERNNLAGSRYPDQIKANFGVYPADGITDRCIYLGRLNVPVYAKSVYQTSNNTSQSFQNNNPLASSVGANYGSPQGVKSGSLCNNFMATEHGYLFVMASLVPTAFYSTGIDRYFYDTKVTDFGWPLLQGTGDQQVYKFELTKDPWNASGSAVYPFGYAQKYAHFKFKNDQIHGLLRDGSSLESFALQRSFQFGAGGTDAPSIGYYFNEIPTSFLDQVSAVNSEQSEYGYWCDTYFKYYKISTLSAYSIPTLGDLKNVHKESIPLGGKRL